MDLPTEFSRVLRCKAASATRNTMYSDKVYLPPSFLSALLDSRNRATQPNGTHSQPMAYRSWQQRRMAAGADDDVSDHAFGSSEQLPSPLIFRLTRRVTASLPRQSEQASSTAVYCGVREFSCDEDCVAIPEWLLQTAGLAVGEPVAVEFVRPEKGLFAQLQALDSAAASVGDLRAILEAHMRSNLTALSVGETFRVPVGGMDQPLSFSVVALEPLGAVDIVDTDLSVDILQADGVVVDGQIGGAHSGNTMSELVPGTPCTIDVAGGQSQVFQLHIPAQVQSTDVVVTCYSGDASVCASRIQRSVNILDNMWFDYSSPSQQPKRLRIEHSELPSGSNTIYVSLSGFTPTCNATVDVQFDSQPAIPSVRLSSPTTEPGADEKHCANCDSSVPVARFDMHQAVCQRHNVKCPRCPRVFKRGSAEFEQHWHCDLCDEAGELGDREKHAHFYHTPRACSCDPAHEYTSIVELAAHRRTQCSERLIECQYCHTIVAQGLPPTSTEAIMRGQHEHEWSCGSRSIPCAKCKLYVSIRQVQTHMRLHEMKEQSARANMVPCVNRECIRERADNPLGLCGICFGPLYSGQYDPDHQKLLKRLARNLHAQLTSGCGSKRCHNMHCASGRANSSAEVAPLSHTEAAAMLVPILRAYAPLATATKGHFAIDYSGIDLHLCV